MPQGEPVKATHSINQGDAFNAYYSRNGEKEAWLTHAVGYREHTAYLGEIPKSVPAPAPDGVSFGHYRDFVPRS
ncbi:hypothetical protein BH24BAC1_BH24BAC1_28040 [soil metagenome]